jgi:putative membrane protein
MGYGSWGFFLTALLWIGLIALGIWLLARLFPGAGNRERLTGHDGQKERPRDSALEILRRRYARGELSKEEYETMRHDLAS